MIYVRVGPGGLSGNERERNLGVKNIKKFEENSDQMFEMM